MMLKRPISQRLNTLNLTKQNIRMNTGSMNINNVLSLLSEIDVSKYDESFLNTSLQKRINETLCGSEENYFSYLEENKMEAANFVDSLHISYSSFFRNQLTFSVLERIILPSLIQKKKDNKRKEIRIWSAACAAGQEVYSLAMLLEEFKNCDNEKLNYRIFAADQNEAQLIEARNGIYDAHALNNINLKRVNEWFIKNGAAYSVKPELKKNITFSVFDLFNEHLSCPPESIFGDFDLVICANLLFYYKPEFRKIILKKTCGSLAKGGYLITGETEREILMNYNCQEVYPHSAIFRVK